MPKVLVCDKLSETAVQIFKDRGLDVDFMPDLGKNPAKLLEIIDGYEGLAIRSATKVTQEVLDAATNLKVIGRAGIGVDNVCIPHATAKGVIVMNTPFGNAVTTAEHAIAMMLSLTRQIPAADVSTRASKWEKSKFIGVEVTSKILGLIGCGNIGSIVADRAKGLKMKVIAFDPFLTPERALDIGVEKVELDALLSRADFISLHTPLTDSTRNIINKDALEKMKKGARLINCARGGLVDESALKQALEEGHLAGAALDVYEIEPAKDNPLFDVPNMVCTPHLGASTREAQENVALQVAEQMSDYLMDGAISNALNFPSITAEDAPKLTPFVQLAEQLGSFAGQLTETSISKVVVAFEGNVADLNTKPMLSAAITGVLRPFLPEVNMVSAPIVAKDRGIDIETVNRDQQEAYESVIRVTIVTERQERSVSGTVFSDGKPRMISVKGVQLESDFAPHMLYVTNRDAPGFIGRLGTALANQNINIAHFYLGRESEGGEAISLVCIDTPLTEEQEAQIAALDGVMQAKRLRF